MFDLDAMQGAFELLTSSWKPWLVIIPGLMAGLIGGAIPGLSGVMVLALFTVNHLHGSFYGFDVHDRHVYRRRLWQFNPEHPHGSARLVECSSSHV